MEGLEKKQFALEVISEESALNEMRNFLIENLFKDFEDKEIKDTYPQVMTALMSGSLILSEEPTYKLKSPIKNKSGEIDLSEVCFRTRISVSEKTKISKGIDLRNEPLDYSYACMSFIMKLPSRAYLDKFSKFDLKVCEQLSTVFV